MPRRRWRRNAPVLLDGFCGQGGASEGYYRAGFNVVGVDINPQPNYPFEFWQMDAISFIQKHAHEFDVVAASPPCQGETLLQYVNDNRDAHPRLISATREALAEWGGIWVIENVVGAPLLAPIRLCGEMFGLQVIRHRLFESSVAIPEPVHIKHRGRVKGWRHGKFYDGYYTAPYGEGGGKGSTQEWADAMGIDWMDRNGLREAIPPAFTTYIGNHLRSLLV